MAFPPPPPPIPDPVLIQCPRWIWTGVYIAMKLCLYVTFVPEDRGWMNEAGGCKQRMVLILLQVNVVMWIDILSCISFKVHRWCRVSHKQPAFLQMVPHLVIFSWMCNVIPWCLICINANHLQLQLNPRGMEPDCVEGWPAGCTGSLCGMWWWVWEGTDSTAVNRAGSGK